MKKFIILIFFIIISFQARAQSTIYNCQWLDVQIKVENPFFGLIGKRKIYIRNEGQWVEWCLSNIDVITDDSFKCHYSKKSSFKYFLFDEIKKEFKAYLKNGNYKNAACNKLN